MLQIYMCFPHFILIDVASLVFKNLNSCFFSVKRMRFKTNVLLYNSVSDSTRAFKEGISVSRWMYLFQTKWCAIKQSENKHFLDSFLKAILNGWKHEHFIFMKKRGIYQSNVSVIITLIKVWMVGCQVAIIEIDIKQNDSDSSDMMSQMWETGNGWVYMLKQSNW